ncbi:hypothetical protein BJ742DRAFT_204383 [Cladochytrium replicatum]|nr:hypothetical protein BJ742DRAFT_204383 [Cladochytrium replicatum]
MPVIPIAANSARRKPTRATTQSVKTVASPTLGVIDRSSSARPLKKPASNPRRCTNARPIAKSTTPKLPTTSTLHAVTAAPQPVAHRPIQAKNNDCVTTAVLPPEVVLLVFEQLSGRDVIRAAMTCRAWHGLLTDGPIQLWRRICHEICLIPLSNLTYPTITQPYLRDQVYRTQSRWHRSQTSFSFFEEPLDLFFSSTKLDISGDLMAYASDDTHTHISSRRIRDTAVVRNWKTMEVLDVLGPDPCFRVAHLALCGDWIATVRAKDLGLYPGAFTFNRDLHHHHVEFHRLSPHEPAHTSESSMDLDAPSANLPSFMGSPPITLRPSSIVMGLKYDESTLTLVCAYLDGHIQFYHIPSSNTDPSLTWTVHESGSLTALSLWHPGRLVVAGGAMNNQYISIWGPIGSPTPPQSLTVIDCSFHGLMRSVAPGSLAQDALRAATGYQDERCRPWSVESIDARGRHVALNYGVSGTYVVFRDTSDEHGAKVGFGLAYVLNDKIVSSESRCKSKEKSVRSERTSTLAMGSARGFRNLLDTAPAFDQDMLFAPKLCLSDRVLYTASSAKTGAVTVWDLLDGALLYRMTETVGPEVGPRGQHRVVKHRHPQTFRKKQVLISTFALLSGHLFKLVAALARFNQTHRFGFWRNVVFLGYLRIRRYDFWILDRSVSATMQSIPISIRAVRWPKSTENG